MTYPIDSYFSSRWSYFDLELAVHDLRGLQRIANTLSTEAPTDFVGNLPTNRDNCGKPPERRLFPGFKRSMTGKSGNLVIY
jgi:hypothetical protein